MKSLRFHLSVLSLVLLGCVSPQAVNAQQPQAQDSTVIRVLYFHGTIRCHTCLQIEEFTKLTMEIRFQDEIQRGKIVWKPIDYEKENDTASVRKYGLENQALIISKVVNGRETEWRKLSRIWEMVEDFNGFQEYVAENIRSSVTPVP